MKNRNIIVLGSYGHGNLGDDAILISMLTSFKRIMPDIHVTVFCKNPQIVGEEYGVKAISPWKFTDIPKVVKSHCETELLVLGGGGLIQDKTSILNLIFWCGHVILAKLLNKRVMCYAVGVGPIDSKFGRMLAHLVINRVDLITVRDQISRFALRELDISRPLVYITADPATSLPEENGEKAAQILYDEGIEKEAKPLIALCLRYWFHAKSFLPIKFVLSKGLWTEKEKEKFGEFIASIAKLADHLVERLNAHLVFVSMEKSDYGVGLEVVQNMRNQESVSIISGRYNSAETKSILGQMDLTIGMHLHSLILSASMGTPIFGLVYDPKITGFMQLIDQEASVCGIEDIDSIDLGRKIEELWAKRDDIKKQLQLKMRELDRRSLLNAKLVRWLLEMPMVSYQKAGDLTQDIIAVISKCD